MTGDSEGVDPIDGVDPEAVGAWMTEQGLPDGAIENLSPLGGGTQNLMLRFSRGGRDYVLRRPPLHLRPASNDVLRREMRLLAALNHTAVRAPRLIAACDDDAVSGGAVFYLMEPVEGVNITTGLPPAYAGNASFRHDLGLAAVGGLADLGAVDYSALGLDDFGKPEGFLARQVPRWLSELESYSRNAGYEGPHIPQLDAVAAWLDAQRPETSVPGIMHGDYHLANLMFAADRPELAAIVDWEMATIGDPLLDLGWLLATWPDGSVLDGVAGPLAAAGGLASPDELAAHYAERSSRDLSAIEWYTVLACFKLGIVLEGTHARACAGKAPRAVGDQLHALTLGLFEKAGRIAGV